MSPRRRRPSTHRGSKSEATEREQAAQLQAATYRISEAANAAEDLPQLFRAVHDIISELMMSWTARNNWGRSSAAFAASEIRYVAAWSCAACSRSVASLFEPRCVEGRRRRGDIPEDQDARRMDRGGSLIRRRRTTW